MEIDARKVFEYFGRKFESDIAIITNNKKPEKQIQPIMNDYSKQKANLGQTVIFTPSTSDVELISGHNVFSKLNILDIHLPAIITRDLGNGQYDLSVFSNSGGELKSRAAVCHFSKRGNIERGGFFEFQREYKERIESGVSISDLVKPKSKYGYKGFYVGYGKTQKMIRGSNYEFNMRVSPIGNTTIIFNKEQGWLFEYTSVMEFMNDWINVAKI